MLERHAPWTMTYVVLCSLAGANAFSLIFAFHDLRTAAEHQPEEKDKSPNLLWASLRRRITYMGAIFLLFYVGAEVTPGNWGTRSLLLLGVRIRLPWLALCPVTGPASVLEGFSWHISPFDLEKRE